MHCGTFVWLSMTAIAVLFLTPFYLFKGFFVTVDFCPVMFSATFFSLIMDFLPALKGSNENLAWIMIFVHKLEMFKTPKKGCPDIQGICTSRLDMNLISSIYWVILTEFIIPKFISICFFQRRTINSCWNTLKKHFSQKNQNTFSSHSTDMIQNLDCKNWVFPSVLFLMRHHHRLQSWQPKVI